jgi:protein O-GlcNAc transferase
MIAGKVWGMVLIAVAISTASYGGEILKEEAVSHYNEGVKAQKSGNYNAAETAYQKALALAEGSRPDIITAVYNNLGVMLVNNGDLETAVRAFHQALTLDQNYKEANFNMGILYAGLGNSEKALEYLSKALNTTSNYILAEEKPE